MSVLSWLCALAGAFGFGLSKTGIPGVGILGVALFAIVYPKSNGIALPLLIVADFVAGYAYFKYAIWSKMLRMFPWAVGGVLCGFALLVYFAKNRPMSLTTAQPCHRRDSDCALPVRLLVARWFRKAPVDPETPEPHSRGL